MNPYLPQADGCQGPTKDEVIYSERKKGTHAIFQNITFLIALKFLPSIVRLPQKSPTNAHEPRRSNSKIYCRLMLKMLNN